MLVDYMHVPKECDKNKHISCQRAVQPSCEDTPRQQNTV